MAIGLAGLVAMAFPAFARHGGTHPTHATHAHGGALGRGGASSPAHGHLHGPRIGVRGQRGAGEAVSGGPSSAATDPANLVVPPDVVPTTLLRFIPSPRTICSLLALYGAFGNALLHAAHLRFGVAAVAALAPALLVESLLVRPVWNLVFRFQGQPSSPLADLLFAEARAVVPFRNGRGLVSAVRDGRLVQLSARLREEDATVVVKVGDRLCIEDIDSAHERVTVSIAKTDRD